MTEQDMQARIAALEVALSDLLVLCARWQAQLEDWGVRQRDWPVAPAVVRARALLAASPGQEENGEQ